MSLQKRRDDDMGELISLCVSSHERGCESSLGSADEMLKAIPSQSSSCLIAITETWCDNSHDWHAVIDGTDTLGNTDQQGEVGELLYM